MRSVEASHQKVTMTNWEPSAKLILFQLHRKWLKNSVSTILWSFSIWSKLEMWKTSICGYLLSWPNKKHGILNSHSQLFYATTNHFSIGLWRGMKSGFYTTTGYDQLNDWTEKTLQRLPKAKLAPKKVMVTIWWSAACLTHWILVKPLHLRSMLSKSMRFTENCKACSYIDNRMGPIFIHNNAWPHVTQPTLQKLNVLGYKVLPHLPYSPGISPNDSHFFKYLDNFLLGKMLPQPTGCRNSFPRVPQIPKHGFLCYRNKQTYFLLAKVYWL